MVFSRDVHPQHHALERGYEHFAQRALKHVHVVAPGLHHIRERANFTSVSVRGAAAEQIHDKIFVLAQFQSVFPVDVQKFAAQLFRRAAIVHARQLEIGHIARKAARFHFARRILALARQETRAKGFRSAPGRW